MPGVAWCALVRGVKVSFLDELHVRVDREPVSVETAAECVETAAGESRGKTAARVGQIGQLSPSTSGDVQRVDRCVRPIEFLGQSAKRDEEIADRGRGALAQSLG